MWSTRAYLLCAFFVLGGCTNLSDEDRIILSEQYPTVPSDLPLVMEQMIGAEKLDIRSAPQFAGAISSLVFRGQEYVNSADHGRLMQGAIAYNGRYECLNPTQAGGSRDGANIGGRSTSQRGRSFVSPDGFMQVTTRMAYWLRPGMTCEIPGVGRSRVDNKTRLSPDIYTIEHQFGLNGHANVVNTTIHYDIKHAYHSAVVEALTLYSPPVFDTFHTIALNTGAMKLEPTLTSDETTSPVILSTADGAHAIAFIALGSGATYARFRFSDTNKISLVYREMQEVKGTLDYSAAWIIGTREEVALQIRTLIANR